LREGEASILGGLQDNEESTSWSGVPGLSSIPLLRYLFGSKDHKTSDDELVFLVVPHVVRSQSLDAANLRTVDTGEGASIEIRRVPVEAIISKPISSAAPARPDVGTIPGQSAAAAGPSALAQLRQAAAMSGNSPATPAAAQPQPAGVSFTLTPQPGPIAVGTTFKVPVMLTGGTDIASVPLQIQYDTAKLSLVNVDSGDFLSRDGQPVALVHRDDGPGSIIIGASRPPGAAGVSGTGVVCVLSFQAKTAGESAIVITHPGAVTSAQRQVPAKGAQVSIRVQ
jgi:general secretion pathway protein D